MRQLDVWGVWCIQDSAIASSRPYCCEGSSSVSPAFSGRTPDPVEEKLRSCEPPAFRDEPQA